MVGLGRVPPWFHQLESPWEESRTLSSLRSPPGGGLKVSAWPSAQAAQGWDLPAELLPTPPDGPDRSLDGPG